MDWFDCDFLCNSILFSSIVVKEDLEPYIIGGGEIYKQALEIANKIELTRVHEDFEADTYFPELNNSWKETSRKDCLKDDKHKYDYSFITYEKS